MTNLGLQTELEDVESRAEEYPLTRAFLKLLDVLTNIPILSTLGTGHRAPGFDPYLFYVKDSVFLKFTGRAYRNETEKWQVSSNDIRKRYWNSLKKVTLDCCVQISNACIKLFLKLLSSYEPSAEDFQDAFIELPSGNI